MDLVDFLLMEFMLLLVVILLLRNISGMYLEKCDLLIKGGNGFSGFPNNGIYAVNGCNIVANSCNFSNNGSIPNKTGNGFHIIGSQLNATQTNVNKCGNDGFNFY